MKGNSAPGPDGLSWSHTQHQTWESGATRLLIDAGGGENVKWHKDSRRRNYSTNTLSPGERGGGHRFGDADERVKSEGRGKGVLKGHKDSV